MKPEALEEAIRADLEQGLVPCAVVATTGTTGTTALDPIEGNCRGSPPAQESGCTWTRRSQVQP